MLVALPVCALREVEFNRMPPYSGSADGRANPTVVVEVGWTQELGPLLHKVSKYLGLQQRRAFSSFQ
jgi:hypothetical protein